ncbi:MAG: tail fiber protein [Pseudomonadota bacterium]
MDPYIGEIRLFASIYAPVGWALCNGQTLPVSGNEILFSLLGTTYGGDGTTTFNLPDLRGLLACGAGHGAGLSNTYALGQTFGKASVTLTEAQLPAHTHTATASTQPASSKIPTGNLYAAATTAEYANAGAASLVTRDLNIQALSTEGQSAAHSNLMSTLAVTYIMCTNGLYPS